MGYITEFEGSLTIKEPVKKEFYEYINRFSEVRHMQRDNDKIKKTYPNWKDLCFHENLGTDGEYFVVPTKNNFAGQNDDGTILNCNRSSKTQPGLWCQWIITPENSADAETKSEFPAYLEWNGTEKFYAYVRWLDYLIHNFFETEGYHLSGTIYWRGEAFDDIGFIICRDNKIHVKVNEEESLRKDLEEVKSLNALGLSLKQISDIKHMSVEEIKLILGIK